MPPVPFIVYSPYLSEKRTLLSHSNFVWEITLVIATLKIIDPVDTIITLLGVWDQSIIFNNFAQICGLTDISNRFPQRLLKYFSYFWPCCLYLFVGYLYLFIIAFVFVFGLTDISNRFPQRLLKNFSYFFLVAYICLWFICICL